MTDANLYLGRLSPAHFLGGEQELSVEPAAEALDGFAGTLGLDPVAAAQGLLAVANATMERAIRVISMERGYDPRDFTLVCFGGAGAMHAADLARSLSIPRILVPRAAGILSALGMLLADFVRDYSQTLLVPLSAIDRRSLESAFEDLEGKALAEYAAEGFAQQQVLTERSLDMRYVGQGYELDVAMGEALGDAFHDRHQARYGYSDRDRPVELVNVRVRAVARTDKPSLPEADPEGADASRALIGEQAMVFAGQQHAAALVDRELLRPGNQIHGPALVVEYSTTTVVPPDFSCHVDRWYNLILEAVSAP